MPGKHALLSPSAAHRWLNCTAAPLLEKDIEDKGSTFAEEGSLAHAYCAKKLFGTLCGGFIQKPQGKPTLVPESDKRPAFDPVKNEFESFAEESASTNETTSKTSKKAKK